MDAQSAMSMSANLAVVLSCRTSNGVGPIIVVDILLEAEVVDLGGRREWPERRGRALGRYAWVWLSGDWLVVREMTHFGINSAWFFSKAACSLRSSLKMGHRRSLVRDCLQL